jgi:hypothetical protein
MSTKILFGTKVGDPDYMEQLITEVEERIPAAKRWALANGFDRLRVADIDLSTAPDFTKTIQQSKKGEK